MLTAYFMRHGQTLYWEDMLTAGEKQLVRNGPFLDLTPEGIANVQKSAAIIAKEISTPLRVGSSPAFRAMGTAKVAMKVFRNSDIEIVCDPIILKVDELRNYDQAPPIQPAEILYPDLFKQSLTSKTLDWPDEKRFNGICLEGRYQSSRRVLRFLKDFLTTCRYFYQDQYDVTWFFAAHSETLGPALEQFLLPPLPLESFPRPGISNEGIQRAQYYKVTVFSENNQPMLTTNFRGVSETTRLDKINTDIPHFDSIYKDKGLKVKDR
jgi:broad specificity phosphatase PhoE